MYKSNINLNLYKTFYDVAKLGSISKAAESSYTSQPAISKAIKKLEEELNTKLFIRKLNGVELTEKGKELLYYVEKSYHNLVLAERNMLENDNLERGKLAIGMPSNIGSFLLFDKIIAFHEKYPHIEITIVTGGTHTLIELLNSHEVDFVIDTSPIDIKLKKGITIKKLKEVKYSFICKRNTKLKNIDSITSLQDIVNYPLILPIVGTANRNDLDIIFEKNNLIPQNVLNIHTTEMITAAVKRDLGIGYVIYNLVKNDKELKVINLKEKLPTVDINIIYNKELLTKAPLEFIENYLQL